MEPEQQTVPDKKTISTPAAIVTGAVIIALAIIFTLRPPQSGPVAQKKTNDLPQPPTSVASTVVTIKPDDYLLGNKNAEVVIFEYSDGDCPFCARFHPTMQQIVSEYKGTVAWIYRHFPLSIHPNAFNEAVAVECAGSLGGTDAFWNYLNITINKKFETTDESGLQDVAVQTGLDKNLFAQCLSSKKIADHVRSNMDEAQKIGARGTPFSVAVNTKTGKQVVIPGAYPIEELKKLIDSIK